MKYFAYGSNLCMPRLIERGVDPTNPRLTRLSDFALRFNKISLDGSTKANLVPQGGAEVWGMVFDITEQCLEGLRRAEGFPNHYGEQQLDAESSDTRLLVTTYIARNEKVVDSGMPYGWYLDHIRRGAEHFGFPPRYQEFLASFDSVPDTDSERETQERAYWQ